MFKLNLGRVKEDFLIAAGMIVLIDLVAAGVLFGAIKAISDGQ